MTNLQNLVQEFYDIGCDLRVSIFIDYLDKDKEEIDIGRYDPEQWDGTISPEQNIDKILEELKEKYNKLERKKHFYLANIVRCNFQRSEMMKILQMLST